MSAPTVTLRPATLDDVETVCHVEAALRADMPSDPVVEHYTWKYPEPGVTAERWIAEVNGQPAGYASLFHPDWSQMTEKGSWAWLGWQAGSTAIVPALVDLVEARAHALGSTRLAVYCREDETALVDVLLAGGFRLDAVNKIWELDLVRHRDRLLAIARAARSRMAAEGIALLPLSEHRTGGDPYRDLYDAWSDSRADVPRSHEMTPTSYQDFMVRHRAPDHRADRIWIALDRDRIVGLSFLHFPPGGGPAWTGFTGTVASHRGRGIARAVKMETIAQAIELGVSTLGTDNDERNAAMLHINEDLGYTLRPGLVDYEKDL
jgi:RimJ/RimL family protein N-acetyltransferase